VLVVVVKEVALKRARGSESKDFKLTPHARIREQQAAHLR
jgi:hypothetical protein